MINTSIGLLGVALQSDKATAATEPTYKHGLTGGGLVKPEREVEQKNVACGLRANAANGAYVSEVNMGVDFETLAYADALALYAYAQMGNIVSTPVDGKAGYYKHVITLGSSIPYLTFWGRSAIRTKRPLQSRRVARWIRLRSTSRAMRPST